jgi:hypothetical protein
MVMLTAAEAFTRLSAVRSGHDVGRIVTADTLQPMDEDTALGNYVTIQLQTREKYCTHINPDDPQPPAAASSANTNMCSSTPYLLSERRPRARRTRRSGKEEGITLYPTRCSCSM